MHVFHYPRAENASEPFVSFVLAGQTRPSQVISRIELASLAARGAEFLMRKGLSSGDRFLLCMDANRVDDLAWRWAAASTGTVPVTVNWQADSNERIRYKFERTSSKLAVLAPGFLTDDRRPLLDAFHCETVALGDESQALDRPAKNFSLQESDTRIIIFTSGTTGEPKPVALSYAAYEVNQRVFESLLNIDSGEDLTLVVSNPLHHANSTAVTDWAMRRPRTQIVLVERFSRAFWAVLVNVVESTEGRVVVPAVSRHFDVLEAMAERNELGVDEDRLKKALSRVVFLVGSAPVGPTAVKSFQRWTGRLPLVRFGSTELCLQALGTSPERPETDRLNAFQQGWEHECEGELLSGFYIGRPHPPWTEARIVASVDKAAPNFLQPVGPGVLGRLIVRSQSAFTGYWEDPDSTNAVRHEGWYLGLGDHGFMLPDPTDGGENFYWVGRDAGLMIRGGSNYSCQQVAAELRILLGTTFGLADTEFDLAVIGLKLESEHEDTCCVMVELRPGAHPATERIAEQFLHVARARASKGARPDRLVLGSLPRNFKGALDVRALSAAFSA